jgi:hypothetical protein
MPDHEDLPDFGSLKVSLVDIVSDVLFRAFGEGGGLRHAD